MNSLVIIFCIQNYGFFNAQQSDYIPILEGNIN